MQLSFEEKIALYSSSNNNQSNRNNDKKADERKVKSKKYIGKLIGKHPLYGSKRLEEIKGKNNTLQLYGYPLKFDDSSNEETISILFVGQSGTGKSTFINAYSNHLLGVTSNDKVRYKLILGDKSKEKDQTKSQTDFITIYNIRSLKYNNRLFKLIDTPGAGDTRNDNEEISKIEQDQKEKEFLTMYNNLFSKEIGQLNSITFVIKASENRENEFQKKMIKNITYLFAGDIDQNCLAILTHSDNDEEMPDAVQLLEKMDIFKKKSDNDEEWYFPVSSKSYFTPFQKGKSSVTACQFELTEESFEKYTKKLLSLKLYYTKQTKKNLELKEQQEKIIKIIKDNIIDNVLIKIKQIENNKVNLDKKMKECIDRQKEIDEMKKQIKYEEDLKKEIENNYNIYITSKTEKENDIKENNERIKNLNDKKKSIDDEIKTLENKIIKPEEKNSVDERKRQLKNKIEELEKTKAEIDINNKRKEELIKSDNIKINEIKKNLENKNILIKSKNEEVAKMTNNLEGIFKKEQNKFEEENKKLEKELKEYKDNLFKHFLTIKIINEEIEKLTLNKSTVSSVFDLINQLSLNKKFIDNRKYFNGILEEYKIINNEIEQSNNKIDIYKKYGLNLDSIIKI